MQHPLATKKHVELKKVNHEPNLYGTFISVLMVGAFICMAWFGAYYLFLTR